MERTEVILSIDAGTQSVRAAFIDLYGNIVDIVKTEIEAYFSVHPGWAEQEPNYYWQKLTETTNALFAKKTIDDSRIKAVTLTTQRGTVINLDKNGEPLRPAILWLDQRMAQVENYPDKLMGTALRMINMREAVIYAIKQGECNWIRQNQNEIWEKTNKFVYLSGWFTYKLTDDYVDSVGNMVGYMPFNYKTQDWAPINHMNSKMFPVDEQKRFRLVKPSEILGQISSKASKETGIPAGLPIIAASADKAAEVLGSGCVSPEIGCLSYGTTATLQTTHKRYIEMVPFFPAYPSAVPGAFNTEVMIFRGYWMINWFKQQFGHREMEIAHQQGIAPEVLFDEMISDIPPGSMGLTLQPYWSPGIKVPGLEAKGSIIGFGDVHTRAHIYRAIIEGLAYALKEGMEKTEKRTGIQIEKIRVSGGGSQSENAMQITADIFGKAVEKPHTYETSALGAAITAAVGMNYFSNFDDAVAQMTRISKVYEPKAESAEIYKELYQKVYRKLYKRLQPLYSSIRDITDYPKKL
jgi:sugar (pentulose or hexulose) kinase